MFFRFIMREEPFRSDGPDGKKHHVAGWSVAGRCDEGRAAVRRDGFPPGRKRTTNAADQQPSGHRRPERFDEEAFEIGVGCDRPVLPVGPDQIPRAVDTTGKRRAADMGINDDHSGQ
jgi:hypothetical protein